MFTKKVFSLSDDEYKKIEEWADTHECTCRNKSPIGGEITIEFTPSTIGDFISARCVCGKEIKVTFDDDEPIDTSKLDFSKIIYVE